MLYSLEENPYYHPEKQGVELLTSIDTGKDHVYNIFAVWKNINDDTLYFGTDSCYTQPNRTPFSDCWIQELNTKSYPAFKRILEEHHNITNDNVSNIINIVDKYL